MGRSLSPFSSSCFSSSSSSAIGLTLDIKHFTHNTGPGGAQTKGRQQGHICLNPLQFVAGNWRGWQFGSFYASLTHAVVSGGDKWQNRNIEAAVFSAHLLYLRDGRLVGRREEERINQRPAEGDSNKPPVYPGGPRGVIYSFYLISTPGFTWNFLQSPKL